jgi:hypothetical protein
MTLIGLVIEIPELYSSGIFLFEKTVVSVLHWQRPLDRVCA